MILDIQYGKAVRMTNNNIKRQHQRLELAQNPSMWGAPGNSSRVDHSTR